MDIIHVVVLALIQGFTEFLPISSSAHLILPKELLGWPDQGLAFDVAVHIGTLIAVVAYFRNDIVAIVRGWFTSVVKFEQNPESRIAWFIVLATVPAGLAGLVFNEFIEENLRSISVIASTTLIFGGALWWADHNASQRKALLHMTFTMALIIGVAQACALIPGTSRSGITITAALILGFSRTDAARFSFLLSIPIIVLSGGFKCLDLISSAAQVDWQSIGLGVLVSAVSAYVCIHYFLSFINKMSMLPFVVYRLFLGVFLFGLVFNVI